MARGATPGVATWNARLNGTAPWIAPGALADAISTPSARASVDPALGASFVWTGPNLLGDLQRWRSEPSANFGWLLVCTAESSLFSVLAFYAHESGANGPVLELGYAATTSPILLTSLTAVGANLVVTWSGGIGPFVLQRRTSLTDPSWTAVAEVSERNATLPQSAASGFFRVLDAGISMPAP